MPGRRFEIASANLRCALHELGAAIASVSVKCGGGWIDAALSPAAFLTGRADPSLAGRTVGPCCGRVRGGRIDIDGAPVQLTRNEGENHLHGGAHGAANALWTGVQLSPARVRFELSLPDGLDGYPGARRLRADYSVSEDSLAVVYSATTDRATWLDMTNHVYWDLGGRFDGSALDQRLEIAATRVVFNGEGHLPMSVEAAEGPFDFSRPASLRQAMARDPLHGQLLLGRGYNNAFLLDAALCRARGFACRLCAPSSGLRMTLETDQQAVVLYSGGFLGADTPLASGAATPGCAVALEAQAAPDPFHLPGQRPALLRPGAEYRKTIRWRFDCTD